MPCYDSRNSPEYVREETIQEFTHNSPLAEIMCELCQALEDGKEFMPQRAVNWWMEHKRRDAAKRK